MMNALASEDIIQIKCFTWNVGNAEPSAAELQHWLPDTDVDKYDLIVVGTQENAFKVGKGKTKKIKRDDPSVASPPGELESQETMAEMSKVNDKAAEEDREKAAKVWDGMLAKRLGNGYVSVKEISLWEMRMSVFAKKVHMAGTSKCISSVGFAKSATGGPGGLMGNKGGLFVKLTFRGTTFAFISCHLAAHSHKLAARNENCQEVLRETAKLGSPFLDAVSQFDHVFWMGDLNYRVDLNMNLSEPAYADEHKADAAGLAAHHAAVTELIAKEAWPELLRCDQLNQCKANGDAFVGFEEGAATFKPTFKVQRVPGTYYKDQRIPSYCDRVLWKSMPPLRGHVTQTSLINVPAVSTSDHKPVLATFAVQPTEAIVPVPGAWGRSIKERRPGTSFPLVRVRSLRLYDLPDFDVGGGSDPYCIFYTNPHGLLADDKHAPCTTVKSVKGSAKTGSPTKMAPTSATPIDASEVHLSGSPLIACPIPTTPIDASEVSHNAISSPSAAPQGGEVATAALSAEDAAAVKLQSIQRGRIVRSAKGGAPDEPSPPEPPPSPPSPELREKTARTRQASGKNPRATNFSDEEVPLLQLRMADPSRLPFVTLLVAIVDRDFLLTSGEDDVMGKAMIPLTPTDWKPGEPVPHEYTIELDIPICSGNASKGFGNLQATITVSFGEKLDGAWQLALSEKAGTKAKTMASNGKLNCGMCSVA